MLTERKETSRQEIEMTCLDMLVPEEHLLRKIDRAVDFGRIYDIVGDLYCRDNGRPSVDPVVLFKIVLIQHLYGIPSLRRTVAEVEMNIAYRWFLGYRISESLLESSVFEFLFDFGFVFANLTDNLVNGIIESNIFVLCGTLCTEDNAVVLYSRQAVDHTAAYNNKSCAKNIFGTACIKRDRHF